MYKLLKLAFISLLMLCFSACREEDPIMPPEQQTAEKTIFVFMPYSNNLYSFLLGNIEDMKKAIVRNKGLGNTRLLLFVAKDQQQSALIDIRYKKGTCTQDTLEKYSSPTYLTTNGRAELLNKVKEYAPAHRYAMLVGSHGMGGHLRPRKTHTHNCQGFRFHDRSPEALTLSCISYLRPSAGQSSCA